MGDSPFTDAVAHVDVEIRLDVEQDIAISRRRLDHIVNRLEETVDIMGCLPGPQMICVGFTPESVARLRRIITRLKSAAAELVAAGF
jgi:hypothetical protein